LQETWRFAVMWSQAFGIPVPAICYAEYAVRGNCTVGETGRTKGAGVLYAAQGPRVYSLRT
jgi:hypothetical protein